MPGTSSPYWRRNSSSRVGGWLTSDEIPSAARYVIASPRWSVSTSKLHPAALRPEVVHARQRRSRPVGGPAVSAIDRGAGQVAQLGEGAGLHGAARRG